MQVSFVNSTITLVDSKLMIMESNIQLINSKIVLGPGGELWVFGGGFMGDNKVSSIKGRPTLGQSDMAVVKGNRTLWLASA